MSHGQESPDRLTCRRNPPTEDCCMAATSEVVLVGAVRHAFDGCPIDCLGCEDVAECVKELGQDVTCGECGHLVLADVGAWTSDRPEDYR